MILIEFGAEVWVGKIEGGDDNNILKVSGYFGIDPSNPKDNYVYATMNSFAMENLLKAFHLGTALVPKFVLETKFPEGIIIAFSSEGKFYYVIM